MLPKGAERHLCTLCRAWGAPERGRGHEARAPSAIVIASARTNPGDFVREVKTSGQAARETPTTRQGPPEESEGAEESAPRKAGDTRMRTDGAGPSPVARREQRDPANAQAVHGACSVDAGARRRNASWCAAMEKDRRC